MSNTIKIRRGSGVPNPSDFATYELAYDYTGNDLYVKVGSNMVKVNSEGSGTVTNVVTENGITGGPITSTGTLGLDFSTLQDMTGDISGTTEFILQNGTTESRKAASGIKLSYFNNDSNWTSNAGTVTSVTAGTGMTQSGTSTVNPTLNVVGENGLVASADAIGLDLSPLSAVGVNNLVDEDLFAVEIATTGAIKKLTASSLKTYIGGGTITSVSGMTNNNVLTASGSTTINGESNLTFDGSTGLLLLNQDSNAEAFRVTGGGGGQKIASFIRDVGVASPYAETYIHAGSADPQITFRSSANQYFSMGIDLSASSFKISENTGVGTNDRLTIDTSGNVGIGVASPNHLLEIEGQTNDTEVVQISNNAGGSGSVTGITHLGITHFPGNTYSSTRITAIENGTASYTGHLAFSTRSTNSDSAPAERMRITSVGDVGIGTNSPANKVHILGDANNAALRVQRGDNTGQNLYFRGYQMYNAGNHLLVSAADTKELRFGHVSSTAQLVLDSSGNISTGVWQGTPIANAYIADNSINAAKLDVSGNGSNGQVLKSNGDGTFSWFTLVSSSNASTLDNLDSTQFLRSDANDTASGQYSFTKVNDHAIRVGTIRGTTVGSQSGEYIHMYNKVHIGSPSGWGSRSAPTYGLSTYGGADLATDTGDVTIGGNLKLTREKGLLWDYTPNTGHGGYIAHPGGGMYRTSTGSHTGALTITIPSGGGPADMISFWVDVFDYVSYESQSFYIAGYVYQTAGSNEWVNETAMMLTPKENHARTVRFGHNGTNHVVYIGELTDTWSYPQVTVRNVQVGFNSDVDTYDDNWDISFEASAFANVDATYSGADTLLSAGKIKMADGAGKFVHNTTSSRDKIRVWNSSAYAIGMQSPNNYGGLVNQYAMTFSMDSTSNRGFLWVKNTHSQSQGAMALTTDGKATIAHSLRLGYGESDTTTPGGTYRLDVSGNSLVTGTMFASKLQTDSGNLILSGGGWGMNFYIDTDANSGDNYNFYSDNALRHILGGDGNVTFGKVANPTLSIMNTATAAGSGPTLEFGHDQGGGARAGAISTYLTDGSVANRTSLLRFWHTQANADILKLQLGDNYVRQYQKGDASDYLETIVNDDHAEFHVASGNYVKISTDSGYVNIGAQNPSWAHFYTDRPGWYFDKGPTSGNGVFQSYSGQDLDLRRAQSSHDRIVIEASAQNFIIDATTRMRLTSSGLDVLNNIYFGTGNIWQLDQGSWTGGSANQANIMLSGASGTFGIHSNSGNADLLVDGAIRSLSDVVAYYSDIRLKHKFEPITSALEKVQSLEGFTYESNELAKELGYNEAYDNLTGKRKVGVSAQQVQEVLPEAVTLAPFDTHKNEDGTIESKSGEDYLTVKYEKIVPLLIEAIKEQQQQINELKEKLNG